METKAKIRRMHNVQGLSIKSIAKKLGIARNTVRSVLRAETITQGYQRKTVLSKLSDYESTLEEWLTADKVLSKKERPEAKHYYERLQALGYQGSYDALCRFIRHWKGAQPSLTGTYVPLRFAAGEAYQFDWSEETVELGGTVQSVKVGHFRLCYSRKFFVIAYLRERQEMLFDAHNQAFLFFNGVCKRGIYDNMKTAVKLICKGKAQVFNVRFLGLMDHYLIEPNACTPASGWEKGQVESQVHRVRNWVFKPRLTFDDIDALNAYLAQQCQHLAQTRPHPEQVDKTVEQVFQEEQQHLRALPETPFDYAVESTVRVSSTCLVQFDRNQYSVDCAYANRLVTVKAYATQVVIVADEQSIGTHARSFSRGKVCFNPIHYVPLLERKPGALRNGAPFKDWKLPRPIQTVKDKLLKRKGGDKECAGIFMAMLEHGVEAVSVACDLALTDKIVNRDHIINILNRLAVTKPPEPVDIPDALQLKQAPTADCQSYDQLLAQPKTQPYSEERPC